MADNWQPPRPDLIQISPLDPAPAPVHYAVASIECPYCFSAIDARAKVCPHCQAVRRRSKSKWMHPREARRTDFVSAILLAWLFAGLITAILWGVLASTSTNRTTTTTVYCPPSARSYPFC